MPPLSRRTLLLAAPLALLTARLARAGFPPENLQGTFDGTYQGADGDGTVNIVITEVEATNQAEIFKVKADLSTDGEPAIKMKGEFDTSDSKLEMTGSAGKRKRKRVIHIECNAFSPNALTDGEYEVRARKLTGNLIDSGTFEAAKAM